MAFAACLLALVACGADKQSATATTGPGGKAPPLGPGYDDVRELSKRECRQLRDHMVDMIARSALASDGGTPPPQAIDELRRQLQQERATALEDWVDRCVGRRVRSDEWRCLRNATVPRTFEQCGADAGASSSADATDAAPRAR